MKAGMVKLEKAAKFLLIAPIVFLAVGVIFLWLYYESNYANVSTLISNEAITISSQNSMYKIIVGMFPSFLLAVIAYIGITLTYFSIQSSRESSKKQLTIKLVTDLNADKKLQETKNLMFLQGNNLTQYYSKLDNHEYKNKSDTEIAEELISKEDFVIGKYVKINKSFLKNGKKIKNDIEEEKRKRDSIILEDEKLKDDIHYVLNYYEFISLGIREGAFEENLFKNLHYSSFMKLWKFSQPLIIQIRTLSNKDTIYQEIEWLATKWKREPIKINSQTIEKK
ncbi:MULTISPECIES: DUF4760 domain-containing protein [Psychrobacter]|jgi:hypothetical protein|uniref:DUF4760 domain-containing protein n=1 Tax=Psychrobacter TaxID=497 RepID=UPI001BAEF730|nr:DUF4760 domain-containing protein [Psychrobacter sp. UBA2514]MED6317084.1 DUF4760 domain-containing protein [Pseudomonadota bacterium]|tara:strand:+ start:780 stop:1622 length:843 start_codon:yes stop_codon:yes gene_type:complete